MLAFPLFGWALAALGAWQARRGAIGSASPAAASEREDAILRCVEDAVVTVDGRRCIDAMNPAAEVLTGWSLQEALGRPLDEVVVLFDEGTPVPSTPCLAAPAGAMPVPVLVPLPLPLPGACRMLRRRDGSSVPVRPTLARIGAADGPVLGAAMMLRDVSAARWMALRIDWAATHDALTGLVNRHEFEARVEAALVSASNSGRRHVVCHLDLDRFKIVNDTCGQAAGDAMLRNLATMLASKLRESDTLARLGGDELGVLLEGCGTEQAGLIAAELMTAVAALRFDAEGCPGTIGVSIGMVDVGADSGDLGDVLGAAATACASAKKQGGNRIRVFHRGDREMAERRDQIGWAARLSHALEEERFVLHYQRYLGLGRDGGEGGEGAHIEILIRLRGPDDELIAPGAFLPAAERYGLMPAIDRWVIRTVFSRYRELAAVLGPSLTCAINLSGATLGSVGLLQFISEESFRTDLPPGAICFEITETAAIADLQAADRFMRAVKALGFSFALDDFGTGMSSLAYLRTLPVDYLKIDGRFIRNIVHDPIDRAMTETINRVGHIMGLRTVAEFAESPEIIAELRRIGIDFAQGYGVHKPEALPLADAFPHRTERHHAEPA